MSDIRPILVAGIGNIFLGDDAFGSEVSQRLLRRPPLQQVRIVDFGIRGLDLVYALLDNPQYVILIDAVPRSDQAHGTLFLLEPLNSEEAGPVQVDAHVMDPVKVLHAARSMGAQLKRVLIVGCQPATPIDIDETDAPPGLSDPVAAAIDGAIQMVDALVQQFIEELDRLDVQTMEVHPCRT